MRFTREVPKGARFLHAHEQEGVVCAWALVDPYGEVEQRNFALVGTGHPAPPADQGDYIGTAHFPAQGLVWHLFVQNSVAFQGETAG